MNDHRRAALSPQPTTSLMDMTMRTDLPPTLASRVASRLTAALTCALTATALVALAPTAAAQTPANLSDGDQRLLNQVELYLDSLDTLQARFTQVAPNGNVANGDFYLDRPGKMRLEYDRDPYLYVADGVWLTFYDEELESRSDTLLGDTMADFIVREDVSLDGDVMVTGFRQSDSGIEVDLIQRNDPQAGQMTLIFGRGPLELSAWSVIDSQNQTTRVVLSNIRYDIDLDSDLFRVPR